MREWLALKSIVSIVAIFATAMALLWGVIASGYGEFVTPPPEGEAEQFVLALKAHRYPAARDRLSEDLLSGITEDDLRKLILTMERTRGDIRDAHGRAAREGKDMATATVQVKLGDGKEQELEFELRKEHGLWKIISFDSFRQAASG